MQLAPESVGELWPTGVPTRAHFDGGDSSSVVVAGYCLDLRTTLVMVQKGTSEHACGDSSCIGTTTFRRISLVQQQTVDCSSLEIGVM